MWSFVGNKAKERWLWHAIDHRTGRVLAYVVGTRQDAMVLELRTLLAPFGSCSQIVDTRQLDWRPELVAIHKEFDDGVVHEHGFRETNGFAC
jgi:insertion element IS1 protein InsB